VPAATLYNWRRAYGGMDTDAARELKELREQEGLTALGSDHLTAIVVAGVPGNHDGLQPHPEPA
jgi:hypothetical protein